MKPCSYFIAHHSHLISSQIRSDQMRFDEMSGVNAHYGRLLFRSREGCTVLWWVRLFLRLSVPSHNSNTTRPNFTKCFLYVACGPGSVLLWLRCDLLCTSGFVDDVMFSHNGREVRHVYSQVAIEYGMHDSWDHNLILLNDNCLQCFDAVGLGSRKGIRPV